MANEIERKFLVKKDGFNGEFSNFKKKEILQAYLEVGKTERRVRKKGNKYFHTLKSGEGLERKEIEDEISKEDFEYLIESKIGKVISKSRYEIPLQEGLIAELDVYYGELEGLSTVEVEFPNIEEAKKFVAPVWFGQEVTYDKAFKNQSLAIKGNPLEASETKCQE